MRIDVWSDFVCPFCYIGKRRLEKALEQFTYEGEINMVFRSYQLDPEVDKEDDTHLYDVLASKYGMSREKAKEMSDQVSLQAKGEGLDFHLDTSIRTNTADAHRLAHFAYEKGRGLQLTERLLKAYFTDSLHIGNEKTLSELAVEVGLDEGEVLAMLKTSQYADVVERDQQEGMELGVRGVPFFVFNQKYAISGAQSSDTFLDVLEKVKNEEKELVVIHQPSKDTKDCSDGSCDV
ncbi:DsbA family oxidoreductase [Bacillus sp. FJAT-45037]|uniref:DsbA family oxidoreductase n=1 Tax=Bacillus sp. FJAT-45037 TaxID=2011007 RepID=UPI000C24673B|nr:DsbA family oxidoreductase [Bacillus sp. FJAT-45037]